MRIWQTTKGLRKIERERDEDSEKCHGENDEEQNVFNCKWLVFTCGKRATSCGNYLSENYTSGTNENVSVCVCSGN